MLDCLKSFFMLRGRIKISTIYLILIWLMITSVAPFTFFLMKWHPYKLLTFFLLALFLFLLFFHRKIKLGDTDILFIWIIQITYFFILLTSHADISYFNLIIQNITIIIVYLIVVNKVGVEKFSKSIIWIITIIAFLGSIAFFLGLLRFAPLSTFTNPDGRAAFNFGITFTNSMYVFDNRYIIRYAGFFDEPGTMAFYIVHAIILNKVLIDNKKFEFILIILGIFTMSLAFIVTVVLYYILFYFKKQYLSRIIIGFLIIFGLLFYIESIKNDSDTANRIYLLTTGRIKALISGVDESDAVIADNRSDLAENALLVFKNNPLLGIGLGVASDYPYMGANIVSVFAYHGFLGGFITMLLFIFFGFRIFSFENFTLNIKTIGFKCSIVLVSVYLQRPDITGLFNNLFLAMIIQSMSSKQFEVSRIFKFNSLRINLK